MIYRGYLGATPLPLTEADRPPSYYYDYPGVDTRLEAHVVAEEAEGAGFADLSSRAMDVVRYSDVTYQQRQETDEGPSLLSRMMNVLTKPRTAPAAGGQAQASSSLVSYGVPIALGAVALVVIAAASK